MRLMTGVIMTLSFIAHTLFWTFHSFYLLSFKCTFKVLIHHQHFEPEGNQQPEDSSPAFLQSSS